MNDRVTLSIKLNGPAEEAYRALRTNIQFCSMNGSIKSICITSCNPNEGKTTVSTYLAISQASTSKKVLLIDADMRKSRQFKRAPMSISRGLSSYLSGMAELQEIISETDIENLHMIICGPKPPNPAELIGSPNFTKLIEEAANIYDMIIIDTPPLGSVIDAAIIASQCDGSIFVIQPNAIELQKALKVKEQLVKAGTGIIGVVLNKIPRKQFKDYYSYYNYYNKYDKDVKNKRFHLKLRRTREING